MNDIFTQEQIDEIIEMYLNNIPVDTIIDKFNTTEHYVRCVLKENQIDRQYNKFSDELNSRLIYLYDELKYVQSKICYDLLVSEMGIKKILKRNGIEKRTPSECNQKYSRNSNYFDCIDSENKAYFLGLLFADGNNYYKEHKFAITLSLQECDGYLVQKFKEELQYEGHVHFDELKLQNPNYQNQYRIVINDEHMSKQLESLGVVNHKSLILQFPDYLDEKYLRHFCRGYFDGDGGVFYNKRFNKLSTSTTSTYEFVSALHDILLEKLDCHSSIHYPKQSYGKNTYILNTSATRSSLKYLSWIYDDCEIKMERKYNLYLSIKEKYEAKMKSRKNNELNE